MERFVLVIIIREKRERDVLIVIKIMCICEQAVVVLLRNEDFLKLYFLLVHRSV